jgi:putrescine aminotransferase
VVREHRLWRAELGAAASKQMTELAYYNSFFGCTTEPTVKLAAKLAELTPGDLNHAFFSNSGSEANDTIVRMVRHFWAVQGQPRKNVFIARHNGYHGSTIAGASLGGMKACTRWAAADPGHRAHRPALLVRRGRRQRPGQLRPDARAAAGGEDPRTRPERVAAFIGEPIQGAAGVFVPPDGYWPEIERICRKYDVLLVADEVITGFGRTGTGSLRSTSASSPTS